MVAHRKNIPSGKVYVPSSWFVVLTVMVLIGGAGWLGWLLVDDDSSESASAATPSATVAPTEQSPEPEATTSAPTTPAPTKSTPTTSTPTTPATQRTAVVSVFNNSGIGGAARTFSGKVTQAGWRLGGIGNWTGSIPANTIYYPPGLQGQAQLLSSDVGIARVLPSVSPMRTDRLTIILSGQQ